MRDEALKRAAECINSVNILAEKVHGRPLWQIREWVKENNPLPWLDKKIKQSVDEMIEWHGRYCQAGQESAAADARAVYEKFVELNAKLERLRRRIIAKGG